MVLLRISGHPCRRCVLLPHGVPGDARHRISFHQEGCSARSTDHVLLSAAGNVYRPHIDGAWPGSGLDADGRYLFDAYGDRWSRLTFLVYLNDNFEGGHTTYYTPSEEQVGIMLYY